jgi:hypothetical protein
MYGALVNFSSFAPCRSLSLASLLRSGFAL